MAKFLHEEEPIDGRERPHGCLKHLDLLVPISSLCVTYLVGHVDKSRLVRKVPLMGTDLMGLFAGASHIITKCCSVIDEFYHLVGRRVRMSSDHRQRREQLQLTPACRLKGTTLYVAKVSSCLDRYPGLLPSIGFESSSLT